jgi:thiol-disulfide isomerase/thioredoxin
MPRRSLLLAAAAAALLAGTALLAGGPGVAGAPRPLLASQYRTGVLVPAKGRVLVVNLWATWCEPCREEMPALVAAAKAFPSKDLSVVLISADGKSSSKGIPAFLSSQKVPFPCWLAATPDPQTFIDAVDPKWDGSLPHTIVYDRTGTPVEALVGLQSESSFKAAIRKALAR